jgi:hypothetical protein
MRTSCLPFYTLLLEFSFENYDLKVPAKYERNELLKKWFTEGFKSNKKAAKYSLGTKLL